MNVSLIASNGIAFSCTVSMFSLGTVIGDITILPGHEPFTTIVEPSLLTCSDVAGLDASVMGIVKDGILRCTVGKGLLYVVDNTISLAVSVAYYSLRESRAALSQRFMQLEKDLISLRAGGDIEDINSHLDEIKHVKAQLALYSYIYGND
ncbi:MAG: hypothetical protein NZL83_02805 [Candidatus Absconditabacterales bacterium]|nr:hypothetical protein [Candidatus Absconditabacterales bacterium]